VSIQSASKFCVVLKEEQQGFQNRFCIGWKEIKGYQFQKVQLQTMMQFSLFLKVQDNWAFLYAQSKAEEAMLPLLVIVCLSKDPEVHPEATLRHYHFQIEGLKEVEKECRDLNISFHCEASNEPFRSVWEYAQKFKVFILKTVLHLTIVI